MLSYLGPRDRKAERREIEYLHKRLSCSRREKVLLVAESRLQNVAVSSLGLKTSLLVRDLE